MRFKKVFELLVVTSISVLFSTSRLLSLLAFHLLHLMPLGVFAQVKMHSTYVTLAP